MKKTLSVIAASMILAFAAHAEEAHHPEQKTDATVVQPSVNHSEAIKKMQGNVKKMRSQLDRIGKAKSDEERQKLMAEHMQTMHENMMIAKGMMGEEGMACPMMKGGKGGMAGMGRGMMKDQGGEGAGMDRMQQMEKRMDMMQMMMERMMQNQSGSAAMPMGK